MNNIYIVIPLVLATALLIFPFVVYYGNSIMVVTSDSMLPALVANDLIIVERTSIDQVQVDDIITFDSHMAGVGIIAHRAIAIEDDHGEIGIDTMGDNSEQQDPWTVHDDDLIGIVIDVIPTIGILLIDPIRYSLIAVIIITAVSLLRDITTESKKTTKSKN